MTEARQLKPEWGNYNKKLLWKFHGSGCFTEPKAYFVSIAIFSHLWYFEIKEVKIMQLTVNFPDRLPDVLQETKEEFEFEVKMALAAKLFQMKRISSGMAASVVGVPRIVFLLSLHKYGVPMIDLDKDELISDVKNA
jgi:predicted HTH domain antitoxin